MKTVPFIDLKPTLRHLGEDKILHEWKQALENCEFVGGPAVAEVERQLSDQCGVAFPVTCANGTDALILALQAINIGRDAKVALPNLTFWASYEAVHHVGAQPILLDSNPRDLQLSFEELKKAHEKWGLDAVVLVHLFGWCSSELRELRDFCKSEGIKIVDDAAQAFGVEYLGESVLKGAERSTLSFYPAKVVGAAGDAGAVLLQNEAEAKIVRSLANHGRSDHYSYAHVGWNSRLSGLQARYLREVLKHSSEIIESRRAALTLYQDRLQSLKGLSFVGAPEGQKGNAYLCVLRLPSEKRSAFMGALRDNGVGCMNTYPETMVRQPAAKQAWSLTAMPESERFTKEVVNLPLYSFMNLEDVSYVCDVVEKIL